MIGVELSGPTGLKLIILQITLLVIENRVFWYLFKNEHWPGCAAVIIPRGGQIDYAMAALLAHEIKNRLLASKVPLVTKSDLDGDGQKLTRMIVESDRVALLLDHGGVCWWCQFGVSTAEYS